LQGQQGVFLFSTEMAQRAPEGEKKPKKGADEIVIYVTFRQKKSILTNKNTYSQRI
jgi:hypothetical protein